MRSMSLFTLLCSLALFTTFAACSNEGENASQVLDGPGQLFDDAVIGMGALTCDDVPLAFVNVELRDSDSDTDTWTDDLIARGMTDAQGRFRLSGRGGDGGLAPWSRPDVYIAAVFSDSEFRRSRGEPERVRVKDDIERTRDEVVNPHGHDNTNGLVNFGTLDVGKGARAHCRLWRTAFQAYNEFRNEIGMDPPAGKLEVLHHAGVWTGTPWAAMDTVRWPTNYGDGDTPDATQSSMRHEFAHTVRHTYDGDTNHFLGDVVRFAYARYHADCNVTNQGFAFNEGWAEFWAGSRSSCSAPENMEVEGNVAMQLHGIASRVGRPNMVRVLRESRELIHSFGDFRNRCNAVLGGTCG